MEIDDLISDFEEQATHFNSCLNFMVKEENTDRKNEAKHHCLALLHSMLDRINNSLSALREGVVWSMLDDQHDHVSEVARALRSDLERYRSYATVSEHDRAASDLMRSLEEAIHGFRLSCVGWDFFTELFSRTLEGYRAEHSETLEKVYVMDYRDGLLLCSDTSLCRRKMVAERRRDLFCSHYGRVFHDLARNPAQLAAHIVDQHERDSTRIDDFMQKYLALEIAQCHCQAEEDAAAVRCIGNLPAELDTAEANRYLDRAKELGLMDDNYRWLKGKQLLACFCHDMSQHLGLGKGERIAWLPFETLFDTKNLRYNYNDMQKTGSNPIDIDLVDRVFL